VLHGRPGLSGRRLGPLIGAHAGRPIFAAPTAAPSTAWKNVRSFWGSLCPGRGLRAAGRVDGVGVHERDRLGNVLRAQSAAEDQRHLRAPRCEQLPVERLACTAAQAAALGAARACVEQVEVDVEALDGRARRPVPETCAALITRATGAPRCPPRKNDGPSSPCSCSMLRPACWLVCTTCSSGALTNTPPQLPPCAGAPRRSALPARARLRAGCRRRRSSTIAHAPSATSQLGVLEIRDPADLHPRGRHRL